jgi:serine/threonine protein kinase
MKLTIEGKRMAEYQGQYLERQFGNYRLIKLLGWGSFSEVYLGEHVHMETQAAIKVQATKLNMSIRLPQPYNTPMIQALCIGISSLTIC